MSIGLLFRALISDPAPVSSTAFLPNLQCLSTSEPNLPGDRFPFHRMVAAEKGAVRPKPQSTTSRGDINRYCFDANDSNFPVR